MLNASVDAVLQRFVESPEPKALALKGPWGVGKTFHWDALLKRVKGKCARKSYAYISLFGISSIAELRTAVFTKGISITNYGEKLDAKRLNENWLELAKDKTRLATNYATKLREIPLLKNFSIGLDTFSRHLIRDTLICFDDFERANFDRIKPDEILGLISELKQEQNCSILLIFNEDELAVKDTYAKYREKVIDYELSFLPSSDEAIEIGFQQNMPVRELAAIHAAKLGINNIRVLRKIDDLMRVLHPCVSHMHEAVVSTMVVALVLGCWTYYSRGDHIPPLEFVEKFNAIARAFNKGGNEDPREAEWVTLLRSYGWGYVDDFDRAIFTVVRQGYIEESGFVDRATELNADRAGADLREEFYSTFKLLHGTFANNETEFIAELEEKLKKCVSQVSPSNLDQSVGILRRLGKDDIADGLIDYFVEARKDNPEVFDLERASIVSPIRDKRLIEIFTKVGAELEVPKQLEDAVAAMIDKNGFNREDADIMKAATMDDYYELFRREHADLSAVLRVCLQFRGSDAYESITEHVLGALHKLGCESPLNAWRVANLLGTSPEAPGVSKAPRPGGD